jgi:hypothetical protein
MRKITLYSDNVIEKRDILNEMRATQFSLVELRFLAVYLSKINARREETRVVRFPLSDFVKILEIQKVNISAMKATANRLLGHVVNIPTERGGFTAFQLFKKCVVDKDDDGEWHVDIDAHDDALPLMFKFKKDYFSYKLFNALRLNSPQQVRMYEILKQYEYEGERELSLDELKELLFIEKNAYPEYSDFRRQILDKYQKALRETTDICYTYERLKKGRGGETVGVKFLIEANPDYVDQLTLDEFIAQKSDFDEDADHRREPTRYEQNMQLWGSACNDEFTHEQIQILIDKIGEDLHAMNSNDVYDHLARRYRYMNSRKPNNRYSYLRSIIGKEI